jgi:DNA-binding transcriptional MerR regulator
VDAAGDSAHSDADRAADNASAAPEYRIGELAREAGITARTLRHYQERKPLPPPRREGRIGWYSPAHLNRLRVIGQLLDRGHTLAGIGELLSAWEQGYDLADLLGFERAMTAPWSDDVPVPVTVGDLSDLFKGQLTPDVLEEAARLGYLDVDGIVSSVSVAGCSTPPRSWRAKASRCPRFWRQVANCSQVWTRWRRCSSSLSSPTSSTVAAAHRHPMTSRGSPKRSSSCAPLRGP